MESFIEVHNSFNLLNTECQERLGLNGWGSRCHCNKRAALKAASFQVHEIAELRSAGAPGDIYRVVRVGKLGTWDATKCKLSNCVLMLPSDLSGEFALVKTAPQQAQHGTPCSVGPPSGAQAMMVGAPLTQARTLSA